MFLIKTNGIATSPPLQRGMKREIGFLPRKVCYSGNGFRSLFLEKTLHKIESFLLSGGVEIQFKMAQRTADGMIKAFVEYLNILDNQENKRYFGKGINRGQVLVSACLEFIERLSAGMHPGDMIHEASYNDMASQACDPRRFCLSSQAAFDPEKKIDWIWGYSLTRSMPMLVPANLVFFPYEPDHHEKYISWADSNGLASGNNLEEAVLHGILEVIERDAAVISEFNCLPLQAVLPDLVCGTDVGRFIQKLEEKGFFCLFSTVSSDHPIPVISAFLRQIENPANCSVAFGCHMDPSVAFCRALTEAVQLLPPSANHQGWLNSASPERYAAPYEPVKPLSSFKRLGSPDLKKNIETCVSVLRSIGSEIIVVDLSLQKMPFRAVRVLATGLQPMLNKDDMRVSPRFFEVPVKLGLRNRPIERSDIRTWPLCGFSGRG